RHDPRTLYRRARRVPSQIGNLLGPLSRVLPEGVTARAPAGNSRPIEVTFFLHEARPSDGVAETKDRQGEVAAVDVAGASEEAAEQAAGRRVAGGSASGRSLRSPSRRRAGSIGEDVASRPRHRPDSQAAQPRAPGPRARLSPRVCARVLPRALPPRFF